MIGRFSSVRERLDSTAPTTSHALTCLAHSGQVSRVPGHSQPALRAILMASMRFRAPSLAMAWER